MKYFLLAFKKFAQFSGRSDRSEYWYFVLFNFIFLIAAAVLDNILGFTFANLPYGIFYLICALVLFIPGLSVSVRRLHDIGQSGWSILLSLIPFIGGIWLLVLMVKKGNVGMNKYGPDPHGEDVFDFEAEAQG